MEPGSPTEVSPYDAMSPSSHQQARVDPRLPLYYQTGNNNNNPFANGQSLPAEDLDRRPSTRRRKPSGSSSAGAVMPIPAAPDAPGSKNVRGGPPISYRDPYGAGGEPPVPVPVPVPVEASPKSFSARAAAQPPAFEPPFAGHNVSEPLPPPEGRRHSRRISTGYEAPVTFPQPPRASQPSLQPEGRRSSRGEGEASKRMGQVFRSSPQVENSNLNSNSAQVRRPSGGGAGEARRESLPTQRRSNNIHSSTGEPSDWAVEKSPLQRLEVKLNDISKEEKRARVMQAEARLRDSKISDSPRRASGTTDPGASRSGSKRVSSVGEAQQRSPQIGNDRAAQIRTEPSSAIPVPAPARSDSKRESATAGARSIPGPAGERARQPAPGTADAIAYTLPRKSGDLERNNSRAVRFSGPGATEADGKPQASELTRRVVAEPKIQLSNHRASSGKANNNKDEEPDPLPKESVATHKKGPKYFIPPQTAAGIEARQQIGFGDREVDPAEVAAQRSHHFRNLFHRNKDPHLPKPDVAGAPRHIDEWRQGGTALLTLADATAPAIESPKANKDQAWWESPRSGTQRRRSSAQAEVTAFDGAQEDSNVPQVFNPPLYLKCGPLLRYTGLKREMVDQPGPGGSKYKKQKETWRGSVMIVTDDLQSEYKPGPTLRLFHQPMNLLPPPPQEYDGSKEEELQSEYVDPIAGLPKITRTGGTVYVKPAEDLEVGKDVSTIEDDDGLYEATRTANVPTSYGKADELLGRTVSNAGRNKQAPPAKLGRYKEVKGIRLHTERGVTFWRFSIEVELGDRETRIAYKINSGTTTGFWVPARGQTMHMMFHSCNGFSRNVDSNEFSGPDPLWRDVLNAHQLNPFHVMIGGGDQIYNDRVMDDCHLFGEWLEHKNPHHKHEAEFTLEIQEELEAFYLHRYCTWFSQGLFGMASSQIPMINIWDDHDIIDGFGSYPHHFMSSKVFSGLGNIAFKYYMLFQHQSVVNETEADEPSWLLGASAGPYINELSRSVFVSLGSGTMFAGLDCRTERTRDEVLSEATYNLFLDRCNREFIRGETKHLILLLGVPIAYPRLVWLENLLTSRALDPLKAMGRMGLLGNLMNKFDGGVEILDDLDDHWTAKNHKEERNWFIEELQHLAAGKSVRVTILSGDVHLGAIGQFYSNKNLKIAKDKDFRYMPNIISSAIVNTPPPDMLADVLNRRNKIHHLNESTDEDMIPMFTHDVDGKPRNNKRLLPKRNWCSIAEYIPGSTPPSTPSSFSPTASDESLPEKQPSALKRTLSLGRGDSKPAKLIRRLSLSSREPSSYVERSPSPPPPETQYTSPPIPIRPVSNFHRRPTNLSERAVAKGGPDGLPEGHINLEHGLDITLNCEFKQGDPSGSTTAYRLLVPALFFTGDDEDNESKIKARQPRKQSLIQRWNSRRRSQSAARAQGAGNWGQDSSGSDDDDDNDDGTDSLSSGGNASEPHAGGQARRGGEFYGGAAADAARRGVVSQQAPGSADVVTKDTAAATTAATGKNTGAPRRSISLLTKRPRPFAPRPKSGNDNAPMTVAPPPRGSSERARTGSPRATAAAAAAARASAPPAAGTANASAGAAAAAAASSGHASGQTQPRSAGLIARNFRQRPFGGADGANTDDGDEHSETQSETDPEGGDDGDRTSDDEEDYEGYHNAGGRPARRFGGKFDPATGVSKWFGISPKAKRPGSLAGDLDGGSEDYYYDHDEEEDDGHAGAGAGVGGGSGKRRGSFMKRMGIGRSNSLPLPGQGAGAGAEAAGDRTSKGYDGIEAYREKKGWKKWF